MPAKRSRQPKMPAPRRVRRVRSIMRGPCWNGRRSSWRNVITGPLGVPPMPRRKQRYRHVKPPMMWRTHRLRRHHPDITLASPWHHLGALRFRFLFRRGMFFPECASTYRRGSAGPVRRIDSLFEAVLGSGFALQACAVPAFQFLPGR